MTPKTEVLSLRMTTEAKALLRAAAAQEHRSVSNMVEHLVLIHCPRLIAEADHSPKKDNFQDKV